jgi:hypothetical protein
MTFCQCSGSTSGSASGSVVRGTYPRIRIRTKMSRIPNTERKCSYLSRGATLAARGVFTRRSQKRQAIVVPPRKTVKIVYMHLLSYTTSLHISTVCLTVHFTGIYINLRNLWLPEILAKVTLPSHFLNKVI